MAETHRQEPEFTENLRAPGWMFAFLGLMLGGTSGGLTAVGIRSFGDEPLVSGTEALIFFACFACAVIGIVYVMLGSTLMETKVSAQGITVRLGLLGTQRTFKWEEISAVRATDHNITRHGGRGNPFAPSTRRSWTMYGVRSGVEFDVSNSHGSQLVFVSSRRAKELVVCASENGFVSRI